MSGVGTPGISVKLFCMQVLDTARTVRYCRQDRAKLDSYEATANETGKVRPSLMIKT